MHINLSLIGLIGVPGAGKSTLVKNLLHTTNISLEFSLIHICYDDNWRYNSDRSFTKSLKEQRECLLNSLEKLIVDLQSSQKPLNVLLNRDTILKDYSIHCSIRIDEDIDNKNIVIICDDNHYYRSMRDQLLKLSKKYQLNYEQIFVECDLEVAIQRNLQRGICSPELQVTEEMIRNMYRKLEKPKCDTFTINNNTNNNQSPEAINEEFLNFLKRIIERKPLEIVEQTDYKECQQSEQSMVHQIDLQIRKLIRELIQRNRINGNKNCREYAEKLNNRRKSILRNLPMEQILTATSTTDLDKYLEHELHI